MKPYYEDESCVIYHGDCREILPALDAPCDLLLTDPPYGVGAAKWDVLPDPGWMGEVSFASTAAAYVFGNPITLSSFQVHWEQQGWKWASRIAWIYESGPRSAAAWTSKHEDCLFWRAADHKQQTPTEPSRWKDKRWGDDRFIGDVWESSRILGTYKERTAHPTQKPLGLLKIPIMASSANGNLVLDPFMGSGSTLRAAKDLGRKSIGIEVDEAYCEIVAKRLAQEVLDLGA